MRSKRTLAALLAALGLVTSIGATGCAIHAYDDGYYSHGYRRTTYSSPWRRSYHTRWEHRQHGDRHDD